MPWWVAAYLCVLVTVSVAGCWDNYRSSMRWWMQAAGVLSAVFSVLFVFAYFNRSLGDLIGYSVFPMLLIAMAWDVFEMNRDLAAIRQQGDQPGTSRKLHENAVIVSVGLIVIPAYLSGMAVACRLL